MSSHSSSNVIQLLTVKETAERLSISRRTLYRLIQDKQFPRPLEIGGSVRFTESDILGFLRRLERRRVG